MPIVPVLTGQVSHLLHRLRRHSHTGIDDDTPGSSPFIAAFRSTPQTINTGAFTQVQFNDSLIDSVSSGLGILELDANRVKINAPGTYLASWRVSVLKTDGNPIDTSMALVVGALDYLDPSLQRVYVASQVANQQVVPTNSNYRDFLSVWGTVLVCIRQADSLPRYLKLDAFVRAEPLTQVQIAGVSSQPGYTHLHVVRADGRRLS